MRDTQISPKAAGPALIDTRFGGLSSASGGHEPALVMTADGNIERLESSGPVLGVLDNLQYAEPNCKLEPDDVVVIFTDGITEAHTDPISLFGLEGVEACLARTQKGSLDGIPDGIVETAKSFGGGSLKDDAAILVVSVESGREGERH